MIVAQREDHITEKIADRCIPLHPAEDKYEHRGEEGVMAMARLHVYWNVVEELDSWPQIARHFRTIDGMVDALGLDSPTQP